MPAKRIAAMGCPDREAANPGHAASCSSSIEPIGLKHAAYRLTCQSAQFDQS